MVKSSNSKSYVIKTKVTVGKSYSSGGWALNREDIVPLIPVKHYECSGYIEIEGIKSECKLRCNPRLFYKSNELSNHLEELYYQDFNQKIPMVILLNEEDLYNNFISNYSNLESLVISTLLPVGKSYSSKGWRLPKDIISKLIPLEEFYGFYPIFVDGIPSEAKIDIQLRLFYKSEELSDFLEDLYYEDPKRRIFAKISLTDFVGNKKNLESLPSLEEFHENSNLKESFDKGFKAEIKHICEKPKKLASKPKESKKGIGPKGGCAPSILNSEFSTDAKPKNKSSERVKHKNKPKISSLNKERTIYSSRGKPLSSMNPKYKRAVKSGEYEDIWNKRQNDRKSSSLFSSNKRCELCKKPVVDKLFLNEVEYLHEKYPNFCSFCIEKIFVLEVYYDIKSTGSSGYFTKNSLLNSLGRELTKNELYLLNKFNLILPVSDDTFKLAYNEDFEKNYSKFTENAPTPEIHKRHRGFNSKLVLDDYEDYDDY